MKELYIESCSGYHKEKNKPLTQQVLINPILRQQSDILLTRNKELPYLIILPLN